MSRGSRTAARSQRLYTHPTEQSYWDDRISAAIEIPDPAASNHAVTMIHYDLATALGELLGDEAGANFHNWAVWGSSKAGVTIRQEDLGGSIRDGAVVAGVVGLMTAAIGGFLIHRRTGPLSRDLWTLGLGVGIVFGGLAGFGLAIDSRSRAARLILHGNRLVLEDIGRQSARFLAHFAHDETGDPAHLDAFLDGLRPGLAESGGQDLLRRAFTQYHAARFSPHRKARQEAAYFANCLAVYHEHVRLQPYIALSMPHVIRKCVTSRMMTYDVGDLRFSVGHDVPALNGLAFPAHLERLENEELILFLAGPEGWNMSLESLDNTAARDWTDIRQRMGYVFALFRALHTDPSVFRAPAAAQRSASVAPQDGQTVRGDWVGGA